MRGRLRPLSVALVRVQHSALEEAEDVEGHVYARTDRPAASAACKQIQRETARAIITRVGLYSC